jgi:unsaturated rhamnogalacturonyl hydrolase
MRRLLLLCLAAGFALAARPSVETGPTPATKENAAPALHVSVTNDLDSARPGETVELSLEALKGRFRAEDLPRVSVAETSAVRTLLVQAVDTDGDGLFDHLVFQADFGPQETKIFVLALGSPRPARKEDFRVYGRFVRERFDDFAWENDRIAHRMYGPALETWEKEPLTSSGVDVWAKRTRALVVNDWYMTDDYHHDNGTGGDFYSVGKSRGCGGTGLWKDGRLWVSKNFRETRVLASGPIRLVFELSYPVWEAGGVKVSEKKRVTLDAGSNFDRFESRYTVEGVTPGDGEIVWAAGIRKAPGAAVRIGRNQGILRTWEAFKGQDGHVGCAVVLDPSSLVDVTEADGNVLVVARTRVGSPAVHYAGFGWDKSGDFPDVGAWDRAVDALARYLRSPLKIDVQTR